MKIDLVKLSLKKVIEILLLYVSSFKLKLLSSKVRLSEIRLLNEVMMYENEKTVKVFIELINAFFKLFLNEGFVNVLKKN